MDPRIIFRKTSCSCASPEEQRNEAHSLLFKLTGKKVRHSKTGRPILDRMADISISHKNDSVCVGIVPRPYKIGVDVEHVKSNINAELFCGPVIIKTENYFLKTFCKNNNLPLSSGIAILWSIKEAFFKCLDYDLKPGKINIQHIYKNNKVKIDFSDEIKCLMSRRKLKLCLAKMSFDEKHVYSQVIMRKGQA